jgi:FkbM family methyltransferase
MRITEHGFAVIDGDTHIGKWAEESGRLDHDQNVLPLILPFIPIGGFVVDAGAYIGDHTIAYAQKVGPTGYVLAFEPNKDAYDCLKFNLTAYERVHCMPFAVGKSISKGKVVVKSENFGMASVVDSDDGIAICPLDKCFGPHRFDFFKIDVEGFEIDVLYGAKDNISKFKPVMFIEVNEHTLKVNGHTKNDLLQTVSDLGYNYRNIYEEQGLGGDQFDIICFPKI